MPDLNKIIEDLSSLTVAEAADLSKQLEEAKENLKRQKEIGDRGGLGGGTSYIEQAQARVDRIEKMLRPKQNQKDFVADAQAGLKSDLAPPRCYGKLAEKIVE